MTDWAEVNKFLSVEFYLSISSEEYLKYYRGQVKWVAVTATNGLKVRFPVNLLNPYITRSGVKGRFILKYLTCGKAVSLDKIS